MSKYNFTQTAAQLQAIMDKVEDITPTASDITLAVNKITDNSASSGQFLVADGQGGATWQTVPSANGGSF